MGGLLSYAAPVIIGATMRTSRRTPLSAHRAARHRAEEPAPTPGEVIVAARRQAWFIRRIDYIVLAAVVALIVAFWITFFIVGIDLNKLSTYGYIGLFVISLVSAASIVLPMPGAAAITGAGAVLDPILGIPVPLLVGLVAGVAEAIGELTGYAAGYGGSALLEDRPVYPRVKGWMERRGVLTLFLLSCFPNPLVDVAGVAAGATKIGIPAFITGVLPGKIVKNIYLSAGGLAGGEIIRHIF
jgi:membrane protein YqaA with SNARE-associated domain